MKAVKIASSRGRFLSPSPTFPWRIPSISHKRNWLKNSLFVSCYLISKNTNELECRMSGRLKIETHSMVYFQNRSFQRTNNNSYSSDFLEGKWVNILKCLKGGAPLYTQYIERMTKLGEKEINKKPLSLLDAQPIYKIYQIH